MADMMLDGTLCAECGVYLEVGEVVYSQRGDTKMKQKEIPLGIPVICEDCHS